MEAISDYCGEIATMDILERDCSIMECGEEDLNESQLRFYNTKQKDFDDLMRLAAKSFLDNHTSDQDEVGTGRSRGPPHSPSAPSNPEVLHAQQAQASTMARPLVILDPATLNKIASSNGIRVVNTSASVLTPSPSGGHSLPAIAPNFRSMPQTTVVASQRPGLITSQRVNESPQQPFQPRQGSWVRVRLQSPLAQQATHVPSAPNPTARPPMPVTPPVRLGGSFGQVPGIAQVGPRPLPPSYSQARLSAPANSKSMFQPAGVGVRLPAPPNPAGASILNGPPVINTPPSHEVRRNVADIPDIRSSTSSALPPPDLPMLPETRPEAASDSRPRPRIGPASRIQRLPSVPSSPDSHTSDMVDLTEDEEPRQTKSTKSSVKGKTFPSLIVTARASLRIFPSALVNNERLIMDTLIRKVMQMPGSAFTEYLMQQRLLRSEQFCCEHKKPLRLGVYSDPKRFPVSGGYVWISDCCKSGFCSVYTGSIFDKTLQTPGNIIKLMYHWACNTAVHNVLNWVKIDSYVLKTYNTFFRAVCTAAVHQKFPLLGGADKKIQVGVISIGTYPEHSRKEVKVDIMAVMDDTPTIRLKVLENFLSDTNKVYESKFRKILEVLRDWVHPRSKIITDFAVDMNLCAEYGFANIVVSGGRHSDCNNNGVMDYMRAKIPVMFQDTLGLLSFTIIQQFLDELVWRETWGPFPSQAYESLVEHIAELTKLPGPDLLSKLKSIAAEPNRNWKYSVWGEEGGGKGEAASKGSEPVPPSARKMSASAENGIAEVNASVSKDGPRREHAKANIKPLSPECKTPELKTMLSSKEASSCRNIVEGPKRDSAAESPVRSSNAVDPAVAVPLNMIPPAQQNQVDKKIYLEPFYYGVVDGEPSRQKLSGSFLAECILCKRDFLSASSFTNHLIHHALNGRVSKSSPDQLLNVCPICCKVVRDVDRHKKENHPNPMHTKQSYMCKICRVDLGTEEKIVKHMTLVHQELDMPYRCDLCRFQTSIFDTALSHFKDFHDKDWCIRCPYCFKTVRFCTRNGTELTKNQYYFVQHVQKHSMSKLNRKCEKCVLSFTNMATLKQHQERVHKRSGRFLRNVRRLKLEANKMLVMSFPSQAPLPPVTLHESSFHTLKGKALSSSVVLPEYYAVCSCLECDGPMTQNHFSVKMTCTRCNFQSCCANSIREHNARMHFSPDGSTNQSPQTQILGGCPSLEKPLYCLYCMFSTSNGNKMAVHLVNCEGGLGSATSDKRKLDVTVSSRKTLRTLWHH